ncbi:hypothetical protein Mapa_008093 [Marchantia paleacea]|nr:hypothetical protein Mapa_008093 [Marchantia paleacea]
MLDSTFLESKGTPVQVAGRDGVPSLTAPKLLDEVVVDEVVLTTVKDGADEKLLPSTEDANIEMSSLLVAEADPSQKFLNDDDHMIQFDGDMDQESDTDDEPDEKDGSTALLEDTDPTAQKRNLLARLKVVEAMLQQVAKEEQLRSQREASFTKAGTNNIVISSSPVFAENGVDHKRQRRPNPKYFDSEIDAEFQISGSSLSLARASFGEDGTGPVNSLDSQPLQNGGNTTTAAVTSITPPDYLNRMRPPMIQRARTALAQKHRVFSLSESSTVAVKTDSNLDNLSIRELHEAYRKAFGRDTSVKDKHWLKRQIFMGLSKQNATSNGKENNRTKSSLTDSNLKSRAEKISSAEAPLVTFSTVGVNGKRKSKGTESIFSPHECKKAHRKTLSLSGLSPLNSPNPGTTGDCSGGTNQEGSLNEVQKSGSLVGGKRIRKPNRRYIEDEGDEALGLAANGSRSVLSTLPDAGNGLRSAPLRLSWKNDAEVVEAESKISVIRNKSLRASTRSTSSIRSTSSNGRRSKHGNNGMQKKKIDARAAKLVKIAHSARAARLDVQKTIRKVKFRLPAAPGQEKGEVLNGGDGEQVSCLLPVRIDESIGDHELLNSQYQTRSEANDDQAVVTVPTANGGTRRKHHRPWTLREVLTLVEGVARCGGGKWADIKKLAFSTVSYRTAVDLKDKWRNLLRASRAQLHPPKQGETRKKQFSAAIPSQLLARVRELAALNNQAISNVSAGSSTSRSGRVVHRR